VGTSEGVFVLAFKDITAFGLSFQYSFHFFTPLPILCSFPKENDRIRSLSQNQASQIAQYELEQVYQPQFFILLTRSWWLSL